VIVLVFFHILISVMTFPTTVSGISKDELKEAGLLISKGLYRDAEGILLRFKDDPKVDILLGKLYMEEGSVEKAEEFLERGARAYPLLRDYALILLGELYLSYGRYKRAMEAVGMIKNPVLRQDAEEVKFNALIAMGREAEAIRVLSEYVDEYPDDMEARFLLGTLYKDNDKIDLAVRLFKDIYINAADLAGEALWELRELNALVFTKDELIERAKNLFSRHDYKSAMATYEDVMRLVGNRGWEDIMFEIGRCHFRLKEYAMAVESFKKVKGGKALYWQARSLYRMDDRAGFEEVVEEFRRRYPRDEYLAKLLIISAEDLRRRGRLEDAEGVYRALMEMFSQEREVALWALGWMYYLSGDYDKAQDYFLRLLKGYRGSVSYNKYLYWWLRSCERLGQRCEVEGFHQADRRSIDNLYYGYLINFRYPKARKLGVPLRASPSFKKPDGEVYDRIEALALLGMKEWALREIKGAISRMNNREEFFYLCNMAGMMGDYKTVIALNEEREGEEYLLFSYPLGYWQAIKAASTRYDLDPYLIAALIREESRFDPEAISWAGAIGLMQLMPQTAERISRELDELDLGDVDREALMDVKRNILIGSRYLSRLIKEFSTLPCAIAAYNAGENAVRRWLDKNRGVEIDEFIEDIPYKETKRYVKKVLKSYWQYRRLYGLPLRGLG